MALPFNAIALLNLKYYSPYEKDEGFLIFLFL